VVAGKRDADGYYAGRILCDILPLLSRLDGLDANAAAEELEKARQGSQERNEGSRHRHHQYNTDLSRRFSASSTSDGLR
jgi:hypothetical protein